MAFDYKKEYRDLYLPKRKPISIDIPPMTFAAVAGSGNPNEKNGLYAEALEMLYGLSYTIKMSKMDTWQPEGYFDFVVAPLEGLWWFDGQTFDATQPLKKEILQWISLIRQPDFVTRAVFDWARARIAAKKPTLDTKRLQLVRFTEGSCVQIMHRESYDDEPATVKTMQTFIEGAGFKEDKAIPAHADDVMTSLNAHGAVPALRVHHEIYLNDPRRTKPENLKTVIRLPVKPR